MGGKDSQNIILAKRKAKWVVLSGAPNVSLNLRFLEENKIEVQRCVVVSNDTDDTYLLEEVVASDCFFDVAHMRWARYVIDLCREFSGKIVVWMGTSGDGIFRRNANHRDQDYYAVHDLHVGMAMGIWHQTLRNILGGPVVSPYQSPLFLDELFYRFDPYFVDREGDVRAEMGEMLLGRSVRYPSENPTPDPWKRRRSRSIPMYVRQLCREGVPCEQRRLASGWVRQRERVLCWWSKHSSKRRTIPSRFLFPLRNRLSSRCRWFVNNRHDITASEVR
jgi:hypothetical protein